MPIDPRKLRPADLARLLNSTPLGEVISERQLRRHRTRAGFCLGDGRRVDLFRYLAWLVEIRHAGGRDADARLLDRQDRGHPGTVGCRNADATKGMGNAV